jgi:predicted NAD-dependent protein-ADP-ribosyltransferase YbiA (DUF1768 family)
MTSISPSSRPFGILCNSVLSLRIGKVFYPTIDHYRMAMLLTRSEDRATVLSYPSLFEARLVFNRLDEAQYVALVREACDEFFRKRLRTDDDFRRHLAEHWHFDYLLGDHSDVPMKKIVGIASDGEGYNIIGQCLETLSRTLDRKKKQEGMAMPLPYLLKSTSDDPKNREDKAKAVVMAKAAKSNKIEKVVTEVVHEPVKAAVPLAFLQEDEEDSEEEDEPLEMPAEAVDPTSELVEVDAVFDKPEKKKPMRMYTVEECDRSLPSKNKEWHDTVNPILAYKVYRITEFLIGEMKKGFDIARYAGRPLDEIIMHTGACPELFGLGSLPITPELRREIYVTFWDRFKARVLPHHAIVENALRYPDNLVQFIRKQYLMELNTHIGDKIRSILFQDFLHRVVQTYPGVPASEVAKAVEREKAQFTAVEYASITDRLYHLFHAGRFDNDSNAAEVIRIAEINRRTVDQIEEAARFLPSSSLQHEAHTAWRLDIDPEARTPVKIRGKEFKTVFHYVYYRLFQVYGDLSAADAYSNLKTGNLQEHLESIIDMRRKKMLNTALRVKFDLYSQIREMILYIKTTTMSLEFADPDDADTARGWRMIMTDLDPVQEAIMAFVVNSIPSASPTRFERAIFLYSFLSDFFRALKVYRNDIVGKKLDARFVEVFFRCFYHQLLRLPASDEPVPEGFEALVRSMSVVAGAEEITMVWEKLSAYTSLFRDESFVPSTLFVASRQSIAVDDVPKLATEVLCRVLGCLFSRNPDSEIRSEDMFAVVQILSGKNDIAPWSDPSFELLQEITHEPHNPFKDLQDFKIYKSLMKKVGKAKTVVHRAQYNILHPKYTCLASRIQEELQRPHLHDPVVARATFALDSLLKNLLHPRRLLFFV